jgi:hypothetical protein
MSALVNHAVVSVIDSTSRLDPDGDVSPQFRVMSEFFAYFHKVSNALIKLGMNVHSFAQPATVTSPSSRLHTTTDSLAELNFTGLSVVFSSLVWSGVVAKFATSLDKVAEEFSYLDVVVDFRLRLLISRHMPICTFLSLHSLPAPTVL